VKKMNKSLLVVLVVAFLAVGLSALDTEAKGSDLAKKDSEDAASVADSKPKEAQPAKKEAVEDEIDIADVVAKAKEKLDETKMAPKVRKSRLPAANATAAAAENTETPAVKPAAEPSDRKSDKATIQNGSAPKFNLGGLFVVVLTLFAAVSVNFF